MKRYRYASFVRKKGQLDEEEICYPIVLNKLNPYLESTNDREDTYSMSAHPRVSKLTPNKTFSFMSHNRARHDRSRDASFA